MASVKTKIADVIVPEEFLPYMIERTAALSNFIQSGLLQRVAQFDALLRGGGDTFTLPYWNDLTGDDQVVSEDTAFETQKITANRQVGVRLVRGNAWKANLLAGIMSGSDPIAAITELIAAWWVRTNEKILIQIVQGIFGAASFTAHVRDITSETGAASRISGKEVIKTKLLMGDNNAKITTIAMHSLVYSELLQQNLITFEKPSENDPEIPFYMRLRVVVDDNLPYNSTTDVVSTYLFGSGAFGLGMGGLPEDEALEFDRDSLSHDDIVIVREQLMIHPLGFRWTGTTVSDDTPTNSDLATAANWVRVFELKNVPILELKHKVE